MTRIWLPALILVFILSLPVQASSQEVKVILDGKELGLEPPARVEKGHVLVPVASFLAALGGEVVCEGEGGEVIGRWEDIELVIPLGCTEIIVNGEERELAVPAKSVAGCIYIPLRQLADVLGGNLTWNCASGTLFWDTACQEEPAEKEKISINSASAQKLQEATGIDEGLARAIVEYRELKGPFWRIEDLLQVPGIDERVLATLKDKVTVAYEERGLASWYGARFQGRRTASGEIFNQEELTAAHRQLPFGTYVRVYCPSTGKEAVVRINDRGPHISGRIIDLSRGAADAIGLRPYGVAEEIVEEMGKQAD